MYISFVRVEVVSIFFFFYHHILILIYCPHIEGTQEMFVD